MSSSSRRIVRGVLFLGATAAISVAVYTANGWPLLNAIYMVVITIFGVGYGEVQELSDGLRVFTIFMIMGGCSALIYILGGVFQWIADGQLEQVLGKRKMEKDLRSLTGHVIVCGFGRIGSVLAESLKDAGTPVVVVDTDEGRLEAARAQGYLFVNGNATKDETLRSAGIDRAASLASVLPVDALNVFITLSARGLNPKLRIVARGEDPATEKKLKQAGATHVVLPSKISAIRMAHVVTRPDVVDFFQSADLGALGQELETIGVEMDEFEVTGDCRMIGVSVGELESSGDGGFMVVAVRRVGGSIVRNPDLDFRFAEQDKVLLLGHQANLPKLKSMFALKPKRLVYRGAAV